MRIYPAVRIQNRLVMNTITEKITTDSKKNNDIFSRAKEILQNGGLVAFPTETVYGLGADALDPEACKKIYEAKGRPSDNPLIVHAASAEAAQKIAVFDDKAKVLADCFWPGPLTLVLKKLPCSTDGNDRGDYNADPSVSAGTGFCIPDEVTGGLDTVAVRVPGHPTARRLLEYCDMFIAAPSANLSGRPSPTRASHVLADMDGRIDMMIADDSVNVGIESTILDMTADTPVILRPGTVTREQIELVLGELVTFAKEDAEDGAPKAPGMKYRHYAPKAEMYVVCSKNKGSFSAVNDTKKEEKNLCDLTIKGKNITSVINEMAENAVSGGKRVFILASGKMAGEYAFGEVIDLGDDVLSASSELFKALRRCDDEGADLVLAEGFENKGIGRALMNRLIKAAGNNIIYV